jgi:hypothetical protein
MQLVRNDNLIQVLSVAICLIIWSTYEYLMQIIKVKILVLIKWSYTGVWRPGSHQLC